MDYSEIIKNYTEEKKDMVVYLSEQNNISMKGNTYHNKALNFFFNLWHEHFPHQKQSVNCNSCRKAVCKFFDNVANHIISERKIIQEKEKKHKKEKVNG